ncbi:MAG: hypothetical protein MI923_16025 [Phycisphaerales bacterium]|nr:hypothetical protein [Phycisphaerales bacterium]
MAERSDGCLEVLNVGKGHLRISFDKNDPKEVERAKRVLKDMKKRGYYLFIDEGGGKLTRVKRFRPETCEYIVEEPKNAEDTPAKKKNRKTKAIPMRKARAVGIAPTAGG